MPDSRQCFTTSCQWWLINRVKDTHAQTRQTITQLTNRLFRADRCSNVSPNDLFTINRFDPLMAFCQSQIGFCICLQNLKWNALAKSTYLTDNHIIKFLFFIRSGLISFARTSNHIQARLETPSANITARLFENQKETSWQSKKHHQIGFTFLTLFVLFGLVVFKVGVVVGVLFGSTSTSIESLFSLLLSLIGFWSVGIQEK